MTPVAPRPAKKLIAAVLQPACVKPIVVPIINTTICTTVPINAEISLGNPRRLADVSTNVRILRASTNVTTNIPINMSILGAFALNTAIASLIVHSLATVLATIPVHVFSEILLQLYYNTGEYGDYSILSRANGHHFNRGFRSCQSMRPYFARQWEVF